MRKKSIADLTTSILIAEIAGFLSGFLSGNISEIYQSFLKPPLSPPGWLFPIVWTILYACMGIASYIIFTAVATEEKKKPALTLYAIQLLVNFFWSIVFFRLHSPEWALAVILLLDVLVIFTIRAFYKINKTAAYIMIPYLAWILFASYLNIGIVLLN